MASTIKWKAFEHSQSRQKGKHIILTAYKPAGMGLNEVVSVVPLYDLRDANLDGSVSILEGMYGSEWYDPYYVFNLMNAANEASCVKEAAIKMKDWKLLNQANTNFLQTAFKICRKAVVAIMVEKAISPGIELNLANTGLAELGKVSDIAQFLVLSVMENAVINSIC